MLNPHTVWKISILANTLLELDIGTHSQHAGQLLSTVWSVSICEGSIVLQMGCGLMQWSDSYFENG